MADAVILRDVRQALQRRKIRKPWTKWLLDHLPAYFTGEDGYIHLSDHHDKIWRWLFNVPESGTDQDPPDALLAILARGHGKSTTAEAGCVYLGAEQIRRYGVYICGTQALADKHLVAISHMLRSPGIAQFKDEATGKDYSHVANPKIERHTTEDGTKSRQLAWRRNMLWTEGGFAMEAMGLDTAIRGAKLDAQRPDFFVLDDLDDRRDTEATVQKKIDALTTAILPAGTKDVAVLGVQNLVHKNSIF